MILYTSGTTSDPKGVVLDAREPAGRARCGVRRRRRDANSDAVLGVLPLFHSLAQLANLLLPFAVGARVVFLETLNSTDLLKALSERKITIFACVPQFFYLIHQRVMQQVQKSNIVTRLMFRLLLAANFRLRRVGINLGRVFFGKVHDVMGRDMRLLVTGGSKFDPLIGRDLYSLGFTILQAYGLTETSAAATINTPDEAHIDTVGRALPGVGDQDRCRPSPAEDGEIDPRADRHAGLSQPPRCDRGGDARTAGSTPAISADGRGGPHHDHRPQERDDRARVGKEHLSRRDRGALPAVAVHRRRSACSVWPSPAVQRSERLFGVVVPNMDAAAREKIVNAGDIIRFEIEGLSRVVCPRTSACWATTSGSSRCRARPRRR